ncbi:MAG: twin-arginine translocase TatA/TatE family subunit [Chloroflexi bacterium]|nr:twin-arginine translocase TatA/TatE family subunit [Chloroflexota bacterium]
MNLFGVGPTEIFVILIVILVLFGPDKLPEIAKRIGGASREIRDNLDSMNEQMNSALQTSVDLENAQMLKPAAPPVVDSTAQPVESKPAETIAPPASPDSSSSPQT